MSNADSETCADRLPILPRLSPAGMADPHPRATCTVGETRVVQVLQSFLPVRQHLHQRRSAEDMGSGSIYPLSTICRDHHVLCIPPSHLGYLQRYKNGLDAHWGKRR